MEKTYIIIWTATNDKYVSNVTFSHREDAETFLDNVQSDARLVSAGYTPVILEAMKF